MTFHYSPESPGSGPCVAQHSGRKRDRHCRSKWIRQNDADTLDAGPVSKSQGGLIRIDGIDIREYDIAHLRHNIGVVLQENFLFQGSIRQNIAMSKSERDLPGGRAARRARRGRRIYRAIPADRTIRFSKKTARISSGGQKQRLAIARALLTDPRILILDEATSSLDPESEAIVQRNLKAMARGRTVILVSHRLSMLTGCDPIVVLDRAGVDAVGTHRQLLEQSKVYRELWQQQTARS